MDWRAIKLGVLAIAACKFGEKWPVPSRYGYIFAGQIPVARSFTPCKKSHAMNSQKEHLSSPKVEPNWWLWAAFTQRPTGEQQHIYGFLAPTSAGAGFTSSKNVLLPSGTKLFIKDVVLSFDSAKPLLTTLEEQSEQLSPGEFIRNLPAIAFKAHGFSICSAFGHSRARVKSGYGLTSPAELFAAETDIEPMINCCVDETGLDLKNALCTHLGGFDLFILDEWLDDPCPFTTRFLKRSSEQNSEIFRVSRTALLDSRLPVVFQAEGNGEELCDLMSYIEEGSTTLDLTIPPSVDAYSVKIYSPDGARAIFREENHLMMSIGLNMMTPVRTLTHNDSMTQCASGHGEVMATRAGSTMIYRSSASMIELDTSPRRKHARIIRNIFARTLNDGDADQWFPRTFESELGVLDHLNSLLDYMDTEEAILVDPYFDAKALHQFILRTRRAGIGLTVITSWGREAESTDDGVNAATGDIWLLSFAHISTAAFCSRMNKVNLGWLQRRISIRTMQIESSM